MTHTADAELVLGFDEKSQHMNHTTRVLHMVSDDGWGGAERVVTLLAAGSATRPDLEVSFLALNEGRVGEEARELGLSVEILDEGELGFLQLCRETRRLTRERPFDAYHVHRYKELAVITVATWPARPRIILTVHGLEPWRQIPWRDRLKYWAIMYFAAARGTVFVAVSPELEARLAKALPRTKVHRITNPLPPVVRASDGPDLRTRVGADSDTKLIGFVGRLESVKGPDRFLDVAERSEAGTFIVVGDGAMREELHVTADARGLADRLHFVGELADAASRIGEFDVLALTSRHEGLPMVLLEAAAHGTAVIAFDVGGVGAVVDDSQGARLIPEGDTERFATVLQEMLSDPQLSVHASEWAQGVRDRFALAHTVDAYAGLYRG